MKRLNKDIVHRAVKAVKRGKPDLREMVEAHNKAADKVNHSNDYYDKILARQGDHVLI